MPSDCPLLLLANLPLPPALADLCERLRTTFPDCPWITIGREEEPAADLDSASPCLVLLNGTEDWALSAVARRSLSAPRLVLAPGEDFGLARRALDAGCSDLILPGEGDRLLGWMRRITGPGRTGEPGGPGREQRLALLLDAMPEFVCYKDGEGRWLETNRFGLDLFGLAPGEFQGKTDEELARDHPVTAVMFRTCIESDERAWAAGHPVRGLEYKPGADGSQRCFDVVKVPLFRESGQRHGLLVVAREISEQHRAELALQHSEETLRRFAGVMAGLGGDSRHNVHTLTALAGELLGADHAFCLGGAEPEGGPRPGWSRRGSGPDEPLAEGLRQWIGQAGAGTLRLEADEGRNLLAHVIPGGPAGTGIILCLVYEGGATAPVSDDSLLALLARAIESETRRQHVEQALRDSESHYREFFENDLTADYISTPDGRLLDCNPAFVRLFGFSSREEALACNTRDLFPDAESRERFLARLCDQGRIEYLETELRRRDGAQLYTIVNTIGGFDDQGNLVRMLGFLFDITRHKQLQQQFHQAQKMESIGRLAGGVAHDFNNLLTVINGHAELLLGQFSEHDPVQDSLRQISRAGERAARLTRQLLAFSRRQVLQLEPLDLDRVVGEMHTMLERLIGTDIHLQPRLAGNLPAVLADSGQLELVLVNLVVNARDAMPRGGSLRITTDLAQVDASFCREHAPMKPGLYCLLEVEDTGSGMDEETLSRVFEPFFTTKAKGKGTGLGLATVYGIIKQVGGFVWLESQPGRGTRVSIYLKPVQEPALVAAPRITPPSRPGSGTVLVVEDEEMVRELASRILANQGYTVIQAGDGQRALELIHGGAAVDLVLSDLVMPRMGGRVLGRELYRLCPGLPVLYMSGHAGGADTPEDAPPGMRPVPPLLAKPFEREELLRRVRELLEGSR